MPRMRIWEALHALATRLGTSPLTGQTAVIVGASRGLGLMFARQLAQAGCKLALCARDAGELERARRELVNTGAAVFARPVDATRPDQLEDFCNATLRRFGSLDMLLTCAAPTDVAPLEMLTTHDVQEAFEQVFWSAYCPTMAVLPHMRARRAGRIVHVSSLPSVERPRVAGTHPMPFWTANSALGGFSSSLRDEVERDGISVTSALAAVESEPVAQRILRAAALHKPEATLTPGRLGLWPRERPRPQSPARAPARSHDQPVLVIAG